MVIKIQSWVKMWKNRCYKADIPDTAPHEIFNKVPSYERIVKAILTNDHQLKSLGFTPKESKYYGILKRKELILRGQIKKSNQLNLFSYGNTKTEENY